MIRILIADDHPIVRRGVKQLLAEEPDFTVLGEARDAPEVLQLARQHEWDVLVLDLNMPGRSGLELLHEVKERWPKRAVLVLSMYPEDQFAVRVLKAGAAGYLNKESAPEELVKAIRKIQSGGKYVSPFLAEHMARILEQGAEGPSHAALTDREFQVLRLLASGLTVSQIADQLALGVKTISTYRTRLLEKMNLHNNAELMGYALRHGLVE